MIRGAGADDAEAIPRVHVAAWAETYGDLLPPETLARRTVEGRTETWRRILAGDPPDPHRGEAAVLLSDGAALGFASWGEQRDHALRDRGFGAGGPRPRPLPAARLPLSRDRREEPTRHPGRRAPAPGAAACPSVPRPCHRAHRRGRHGGPVVLRMEAGAMHRDGLPFWQADDGVWLTEAVPPRYLVPLAPGG